MIDQPPSLRDALYDAQRDLLATYEGLFRNDVDQVDDPTRLAIRRVARLIGEIPDGLMPGDVVLDIRYREVMDV